MRRVLCRLDCRVFIVTCGFVGAVKPARRKDARHLLHIAAAVKREIIHQRHIRIGMIVPEIFAVIQPPDSIDALVVLVVLSRKLGLRLRRKALRFAPSTNVISPQLLRATKNRGTAYAGPRFLAARPELNMNFPIPKKKSPHSLLRH